jgi:hypothetical protein
MSRVRTRPTLALHALAGDLACNDAAVRETWHARGMLPVGLPHTVAPLPPSPPPEDVLRSLDEADWPHIRTPTQGRRAYAGGSSRPVVESSIASLWGRGAGRLSYKGQRGAIAHTGRAVMAPNAATLVRSHAYRLSKRARTFRRGLRLRWRQVSQGHAPIN